MSITQMSVYSNECAAQSITPKLLLLRSLDTAHLAVWDESRGIIELDGVVQYFNARIWVVLTSCFHRSQEAWPEVARTFHIAAEHCM